MATKNTSSAFHELGMPDADELVVKSRLIRLVAEEIRRRGLTQKEVGDRLGLDQPNVSALVNEKLSRFSVRKLMTLAGRLGFKVSVRVEGYGASLNLPYGTTPFDLSANEAQPRTDPQIAAENSA